MAIDFGDAHTGVAISDPMGLLAGTALTIDSWSEDVVLERICQLVKENRVEEIVLGHPVNMDGTRGPRAEKYEAFGERLRQATGLVVVLWDERRTSVEAHQILSSSGKKTKKHKAKVDAVAATLILEGYLTFKRTRG
jgi:putative Holliday junction resolvase